MEHMWLTLSAPMGAGKDTVARLIFPHMGVDRWRVRSWADPLRGDVDMLLSAAAGGPATLGAAAEGLSIPDAAVDALYRRCRAALAEAGPSARASDRTPQIRELLQWYGTDVWRAADQDYWVRRTMSIVSTDQAGGFSVVTPDTRFVNEVELPREQAGALAVRMTVSPQVQRQRLLARDGHLPAAAAFSHPSETVLAGYDGFDAVVDTSQLTVEGSVAAVCSAVVALRRPAVC